MMDRLREGVNSIAIKIILGVIILSFVFAGVSSYLVSGKNNSAAKVGDTQISRIAFDKAYQGERNRMQSQLGDYFSNMISDPGYVASFKRSVLDKMVNDVLIKQYAQSLGLRISDSQIRQAILDIPQFKSNGKFNQETYQSLLRANGFTPDSFAEQMRSDMLKSQIIDAIQTSGFSLESEVQAQAALFSQKRDIRTALMHVDDYAKKVKLSDDEVNQYYKSHQSDFMRPEQFKVSYIELSAKKLKEKISISDEEAKKYYQDHQSQYSTKEQRKVSHILVKDKSEADAILKQLNAGEDFAELAKEKSQDPGSANHGGQLDWFEHGVMDPEFEKAAFALKKAGDLSQVVKSTFGYHIIRLDDVKPSVVKPFKDVQSDIVSTLSDEKAADRFYKLQSELEKVAFESPDSLDDAAKVIDAKIRTTDFVSANELPEVISSSKVKDALMNNPEVKEEGLNSSVIEIAPEDVVVVRVEEVRPEMVLALDKVRDKVVSKLSRMKGEQEASSVAQKVLAALQNGDQSPLKENQLSFGELSSIDRSSPLSHAVFAMKKPEDGGVVYGQTKDQNGDIVFVELTKVTTDVDEQLSKSLGAQMVRSGSQQDIADLLEVLRSNTEIEYYLTSQ
ncbi:Peptidyl-prolyl cis-trans isomerase D [Vibrio aerogenes CECT 7868]|uniref:Periplasmic chaperone PpiD n=1 Tax=Vibrio aerogenes CECT 7868 TaxID=1216006 RepID=A0A1M5X564_9VIBR|nr:peptidylprolyl isomerase [Vibrio aerogenes]SHH94772.1 Peptidyl-prolyl cis-trans isomerase D [Vibrio aerogenes CECT 7868]